MLFKKKIPLAVVSVAIFTVLGCAEMYHEYPDCVPYNYCPMPPLPHTFYDGCTTPIAEQFRRQQPETSEPLPPQNDENEARPQ